MRIETPKWRCAAVGCQAEIPTRQLFCAHHLAMLPPHIRLGLAAAVTGRSADALDALDQARTKIAQREGLWAA